MSDWEELGLQEIVTDILRQARWEVSGGGYYFVTSYHLALEVKRRDPGILEKLGKPLGGKGTGGRDSVARYLGQQLEGGIRHKKITNIEMGYLYAEHMTQLTYKGAGAEIDASIPGKGLGFPIFRYIP